MGQGPGPCRDPGKGRWWLPATVFPPSIFGFPGLFAYLGNELSGGGSACGNNLHLFFFFSPALAGNSFSLCPWRCLTHNNHVFRTSQKCVRKLSRLFLPQAAREPVGIERRIERVLFAILLSRHLMSRARRRENTAPCPGF